MIFSPIRRNSRGVGALAAILAVVVVAVIVVVGIVVLKHHDSNDKTVVTKSNTSGSATKQVSGVTFSDDLNSLTPVAMTSDLISKANESQQKYTNNKPFFTVAGGYSIPTDNTALTIEWGQSLRTLGTSDFKDLITNTSKALGIPESDTQIKPLSNETLKTSGESVTANCFLLTATIEGQASYSTFCAANVQKSTVYYTAGGSNEQDSTKNMQTLVSGSTLTLQ